MNADFFFPWLFCQPSSPLGGGAAGLQKKEHVESPNLAYNHIKSTLHNSSEALSI